MTEPPEPPPATQEPAIETPTTLQGKRPRAQPTPQIQEEAIIQLADLLMGKVSPDGLAVVFEADHYCMHWRGVKDTATKMVNSVMRGSFLKDAALRREFLSLIDLKR